MDECEYLKSSNSKTMNNIERECSIGNCIKIDQTKYIFLQKVINSYQIYNVVSNQMWTKIVYNV